VNPNLEREAVAAMTSLITNGDPADFIAVAALLPHFTMSQMVTFAQAGGPRFRAADIGDVPRHLDKLTDAQFAAHGLTSAEIKRLRIQFEGWPW